MRPLSTILVFIAHLFNSAVADADTKSSLAEGVARALALLEGAEQRFQAPSEEQFYQTQAALREEVERVGRKLDAKGADYAQAWKTHLRWDSLERNLHSTNVNLSDLELVRRWMFSNRAGLEGPLFAELRRRTDAYLDAAFTSAHEKLQATFNDKVAVARKQCAALLENASDANAAALGSTLGWFDRTGQIGDEVANLRLLLSHPNAQIVVSSSLAQSVLALFDNEVDDTLQISDYDQSPPSGILQRRRTLRIRGFANTVGTTSLALVPNDQEAQLNLIFQGHLDAHCTADAGPAAIHVATAGPVKATKPIYVSTTGLRVGDTLVDSRARTRMTGLSARSNFFRRVAKRRANAPEARASMRSSGHNRTNSLLKGNVDTRVDAALSQIKAEIASRQQSVNRLADILAPVAREGAQPTFHSVRSTADAIEVNAMAARRHQFGAVTPYRDQSVGGDLQIRLHVSLVNNMLETILGGKDLSDEFLMRYAKILQAELPMPLMVHSRAQRWSVTTRKHRPLGLRISARNQLELVMRLAALEIDNQHFDTPATATVNYQLAENEFGEYELVRDGDVYLDTLLATEQQSFLHNKLDAFFAPLLNAGGVIIPEGDVLGAINDFQPVGVVAANEWIAIGIIIPQRFISETMGLNR